MTSPIEQMIDKACGYDPNKANQFGGNTLDARVETLLELAYAAVEYAELLRKDEAVTERFLIAVDAWISIGG